MFSPQVKKGDMKIINASQIFAHTFLALFLYELLLAENSYQTPWLPKRKKKNNPIKKNNSYPLKEEEGPFNI